MGRRKCWIASRAVKKSAHRNTTCAPRLTMKPRRKSMDGSTASPPWRTAIAWPEAPSIRSSRSSEQSIGGRFVHLIDHQNLSQDLRGLQLEAKILDRGEQRGSRLRLDRCA